jgi:hypothetical protein
MSSDDGFSLFKFDPAIEPTWLREAADERRDEEISASLSCGAPPPPPPSLAARLAARLASRSGSISVQIVEVRIEFKKTNNLSSEKNRIP